MAVLQVFVVGGCVASRRAKELAEEARVRFPTVHVEVVNLGEPGVHQPEHVFAVPTFVLDGRVLSLGNPRPAALMRKLAAHLETARR